ncbi:hypothetical protein WCX72_09785 [Sulfurimonas sp. HSL1-6]|uniref:hypothetical protein n=1 Tax=Thiomicrolovo immobilis TaxID=3131935 RepID=UPI0031F8C0F0
MKPQSYKDYIPKGARVLHLVVTQHWLDKIAEGRKPEDFRKISSHWIQKLFIWNSGLKILKSEAKQLEKAGIEYILKHCRFQEYDYVVLSVGYKTIRPQIISKWGGTRITVAGEQTDLGVGRFFAVDVSDVLHVLNYENQSGRR